jgi:hypothetical protein
LLNALATAWMAGAMSLLAATLIKTGVCEQDARVITAFAVMVIMQTTEIATAIATSLAVPIRRERPRRPAPGFATPTSFDLPVRPDLAGRSDQPI